jgi:hypothetical protein
LGNDFDFTATAGDVPVNVEVTALTAKEPSDATVLNALREKRRQLPTDAPAVIYCVIPKNWQRLAPPNWDDFLEKIMSQFFRNTKRVNVVVFWMEEHIIVAGGRGAALTVVRKPYVNQNARHAMDVSLFFSGQRSEPLREALATADADGLKALERASRNSEFFRWIDYLNPPQRRGGAFTLACIAVLLVVAARDGLLVVGPLTRVSPIYGRSPERRIMVRSVWTWWPLSAFSTSPRPVA